jgi:hypothetical protein
MPVPDLPQAPATASPVVGDLASLMRGASLGRLGGSALLAIAPNDAFFLRHHPRAWRVSSTLEDPVFLPDVTKHVLAPGCNGVRTLGEHDEPSQAYEDSVHSAEKKGWLYLSPLDPVPADCLPAGVPEGGYLRALDCRHPLTRQAGQHHVEAWCVPIATLPDEDQQFRFDVASYERWLRYLVLSGQVAPPNERVVETMRSRVREHVARTQMLNVAPDIREQFVAKKAAIAERYAAAQVPVSVDDPPKRGRRAS